MKRGMFNRVVSLILAVTMVFTIGFDPTLVMAKEGDEGYVITGFTALERDVREQRLEVGSSESDIVFPKELKATIEHTEEVLIDMPETTDVDDKNEAVAEEGANTDEITPSDTGDSQTDAASEENNEITEPKSEVTEPVVDNAPAEVAPEPTAEPAPVAEPTPATEPASTPEPAPAPEPASTPEPETGGDPVAFIIDSLFPSITAQAEELDESTPTEEPEAPTEEPASEPTAEAPAVEPVEEPGEPAEQSTEQAGETVPTSEPAIQVKPVVNTEEITIQGVTWTLDAENSSAPSFDGSILGAKYVYKPVIDSKYVVKSELPTITVEIVETQFYFEGSVTVDGVIITVKADKGVFPSDAVLNARRATKAEEAVAEDAVEDKRTAPNVAASYTFDIKILDKDGNELQPDTSKGKVKVAFTLEEARDENLEADIYHITDENPSAPEAEKLDTDNYASTVEAETTGFSFYTVEFTYGGFQYVLIGGTTILLSEILDVLGIEGTVVSATSSNESLFYARKYIINESVQGVPMPYMEESPEGQWYLVSCQAFSSQEMLTLDMEDGSHYEIEVTDSAGVVGAHSDTNDGNVFLGGHYIEVGIAKTGSFGTSGAPKTEAGFHPVYSGNKIGLSVDKDGFGEGNSPTTCDFFLPGTPEERYIVAYKMDGNTYENHNAERCSAGWASPKQAPTTIDESDIKKGQLKATTTGITREGVKMVTTISFGEEDYSFLTTVTLTNNTGKKITDLRWVRSFDPDQNAEISGGTYSTYNKVISNPNTNSDSKNQCAMVVAKGGTNKEAFFFAAFDERARASILGSLNPNSAYDSNLWTDNDKMPVEVREENYVGAEDNGYVKRDVGIALTFNLGTLENGGSTTLEYYSSLDPDVAHTFNSLNGRINYNGETIDGFTPDTTYLITVYRDAKGKYFRVQSDAKGSIMIEDTDKNGYAYSLFGKSIRVRELSEEAGIQYLDVNPRPVALDVNEAEDSINSGSTTIKIALSGDKVGQEYRLYDFRGKEIAGQTWQNPTGKVLTLTGLKKNTSYILKAHVKATATFPESKVSAGTILTTIGNDITVDYDDEVITGLKPHTIYEIVCGGGGGKPILVETDDKGEIPFEGEDEDGKPYDLTGEEIIIREPGSDDDGDGDDSPEIIKKKIDGRPTSEDVKPIDTGDPDDPEDTGAIAATGRTITICPAEKDQEYRIYDNEGKEIPGHGWVTPTKDGKVYKVVFKDLDYDKEYIVKTRIAATDGKPASEPTDGTEVKTDDETDEDDIDVNYDDEVIEGLKPSTVYEVTEDTTEPKRWRKVYTNWKGRLPLRGKDLGPDGVLPTDDGEDYDFVGKTIEIREPKSEGEDEPTSIPTSIAGRPAPESIDPIDTGTPGGTGSEVDTRGTYIVVKPAIEKQEYRIYDKDGNEIEGRDWVKPTKEGGIPVVVFDGLEPGTKYIIKTRIAASPEDNTPASEPSEGIEETTGKPGDDLDVDYEDETIGGLLPDTDYVIEYDDDNNPDTPDKNIRVKTDEEGKLPIEGTDRTGNPYDLTGKKPVKFYKYPKKADSEPITKEFEGRPTTDDPVKPIDTGDTGDISATGRTITINPAEKDQEYRIYKKDGNEISGQGWIKPTKDGSTYKVVFKDLDYGTEYTVKTRKVATEYKPASKPTDGVDVSTDEDTDKDDVDVNYDDEVIEGFKPHTIYKIVCGGGGGTGTPILVETDDDGHIPFEGTDKDGNPYDLTGDEIIISEPGTGDGEDPEPIIPRLPISGRPAPTEIDPIDTGTPGGTGSEVDTRGTYIVVKPANKNQEYRIYDEGGNGITGKGWVKPTMEGGIPVVVFNGLEPEKKYTIKTRIAATDTAPASEPTEGIVETTGEPGDDLDVDYEDETIGGLLPDTEYVIEYDDDNNPDTPDKNIRVKTDKEGKLPIEGTDKSGNPYDLAGKKPVKITNPNDDTSSVEKDLDERPNSDDVKPIDTGNPEDSEDTGAVEATGRTITINPAEKDQEYRIYDKDGKEISGQDWIMPTKDGSTYKVIFKDLDYNKEYIVKTRKPSVGGKPASEPKESTGVKTDNETDEDDIDVNYEDEVIEGLKPNTVYEIAEKKTPRKWRKVRTDANGRIPIMGTDLGKDEASTEDDEDYDFIGKNVEIREPKTEDETPPITIPTTIGDRPTTGTIDPIDTGDPDNPADTGDVDTRGTYIVIKPANMDQEYRIYDKDGKEIAGRVWVKPTDEGHIPVVVFDGLNPETEYIIKTRIAPTDEKPASEPTEGVKEKTGTKSDDIDVDYEDETIGGLIPEIEYEIEYDGDNNPETTDDIKKITVRTDKDGKLPIEGKDLGGNPYDLAGKKPIKIKNSEVTGSEPVTKEIEGRPATSDPVTEVGTIGDSDTKGTSITVKPAEQDQEYRIYDKSGNEITGYGWVKPTKDGSTYTVVFEDLDYDKEYVIKTRKAPTSGKPGSEPTEGVTVKTDDVTDEDVDVDYEDEYIEGLKPNTEYDVYENESGTGGADERGRRHRVRTDSRGRIPFTGKDEDDKDYDFTGTKIEILEPGKEDTTGIKEDIPDRPDNTGVKDAEEKDIESKGTSITIYDADPDQEYRIYDENGHEISGRDWTKPDEDGVVKFKDLDYNKRYIVKARKAPKSKTDAEGSKDTPGSEPSEGIEVTTGDKTDVTDVDIDYEDEVIEGLKPNTVYEITDRKTGKKHRVRTTRKGRIPFTGEDVDGESYDITGEPITISEDKSDDPDSPDGEDSEPIIKTHIEDRPSTDDIDKVADDELKTKGKSITIRPADEALEYRIYDKDGNELPGRDWVKPDKDLVVIFDDLDYDTDYIIRARIAPTDDTPGSEPKDVKEVKTDDVKPDDVVIDYEDEEIEGLKPDTEYEIEYTSEDPVTHETTKKKRKVRTDRHGRIPFNGTEVGTDGTEGPKYNLADENIVDDEIKISETGSDKDPIDKKVGDRPSKDDVKPLVGTTGTTGTGGTEGKPADVAPKGTTITINPAEPTQEYRVYKKVDDKLVEVTGQDWTKPTGGKVVFTDLDFGTEYIVKTRIAPTSEKPASLPSDDEVTVTTKDMDDPVVDYVDDEIGGFKPNTEYEVSFDDDADPTTPDKKITVKTDKDGKIDIEGKGKDKDGKDCDYDLEDKTIKVKEKKDDGSGEETEPITLGSRPSAPTPDGTDIYGTKGPGTKDEPIVDDIDTINIYQESIEILDLNKKNKELEYRIYDEDGNEIDGQDWVKPDKNGNVKFKGLEKGKKYTIKARKPATEKKPASKPTGTILTVKTNDVIGLTPKEGAEGDETVLEGKPNEKDEIGGFKPNTEYEVSYDDDGDPTTPDKKIVVKSDKDGIIKVDGDDEEDKHFSLYGKKIKVRKKGSKDKDTIIDVTDTRPEAPTFDPEDWGTTGGTIESDTKKIKIYQKEIRITGLSEEEKELEYRVYGPDGEELPEYGWVKPSADGEVRLYGGKDEEGKLALDKMLLGDSEYIIKARKPATKEVPDEDETPGTPGVPASDAVIITKVKTDPVVYPEIDVREEVIDGCKPNTFYDITVKEGEETVIYTVKSDKDGDIILEGKDKDGKEFSLIGKDIVVKKSDTSDDYPKDDLKVPSRPEPIKFVEDEEAEVDVIDEDTEQVNLSESIIYINGLSGEKNDYEYCLFDEAGNEIPGMEWKMPEDGILVFEGLPSDTVYTIKARKPSTGKKLATLPVTTGLKIKTDISYVPVVNYDTDRIEGLKPETEYDVWVGDDVYYLKTDENGGFTLKGVDYNGVEYNFEGQDLEIQINGKTEIKALSVPTRPETVPEEPIPTPTATSSGGGEGVSYPVIPKPEVVEEVLPEIAQEVAEETQTTPRRTAAVEEETEEIGKGNIIDRGDIWGDMSNETKQKLLDKLDESGGEIIKADDIENVEEVPVKDRPIAFVIGEGSVIVTIESTDTTRTNAGLKDAAAVAASILTPEQREAVEAGSILEIRVEVTPLDEDAIPALDKQIMEEGLVSYAETMPDLVMADYVDISLYFRIDDSDWSQITDTEPIEIVIDIPDNYKGLSDTYYIMRAHQGETTLLEDLDDDIDTVTISTGQFSTYALMYEQHAAVATIEKTADKCSLCHMCPTFLGICYFIWLAIFAAVAIGLVTFNTISKKSKKSEK